MSIPAHALTTWRTAMHELDRQQARQQSTHLVIAPSPRLGLAYRWWADMDRALVVHRPTDIRGLNLAKCWLHWVDVNRTNVDLREAIHQNLHMHGLTPGHRFAANVITTPAGDFFDLTSPTKGLGIPRADTR